MRNCNLLKPGNRQGTRRLPSMLLLAAGWMMVAAGGALPAQDEPAAAASTAARSGGGLEVIPAELRPCVWWSGPDSSLAERQFLLIGDRDGWVETWARHTGRAPARDHLGRALAPEIDFERWMVLAVFQGSKRNSSGVILAAIEARENALVIRFDESTYQTAGPDGGAVEVQPFGLFVLPRSSVAVVVEEDIQNLKGQPPKWQERARFEPLPPGRRGR